MDPLLLEILVKYVHFICIFAIVGAVSAEHLLLKEEMTRAEIHRLSIIDAVYGVSAILLLAAGFTLWFAIGKPADFYSKNWVFHTKITFFIIVGILSLWPTRFFLRERKGEPTELVAVPKRIKMMIRLELLLLFLIPLLASTMAKGIGQFD